MSVTWSASDRKSA